MRGPVFANATMARAQLDYATTLVLRDCPVAPFGLERLASVRRGPQGPCESAGYLPMDHVRYQAASVTGRVAAARSDEGEHDPAATMLWDQFVVVVKTMRTGKAPWGVPAYNGALFAPAGFDGAATLEGLSLTDAEWGPVLVGLGWDEETGTGVDYSTLAIGHLGHLYEGLLSLRLSVADVDLTYDARTDRYVPAGRGDTVAVRLGELRCSSPAAPPSRKADGVGGASSRWGTTVRSS